MKLSIITINYNNRDGLQKTIDSVICQTWSDYEWIVVDGGSTDGSKELIEKYKDYFAYWCSEPDKGIYNAMNKGIAHAKGEYLLFLNSGDCLHLDITLEMVFKETKTADVIYGDITKICNTNSTIKRFDKKLSVHFFISNSIGHSASFIKSSLLKTNGYREDFEIVSDWCKFLEWFRQGKIFKHIDIVISDFDMNGISNTSTNKMKEERETVLTEIFGKENRQWVEESISMQILLERYDCDDMQRAFRIKEYGGRKLKWMFHWLLRVLNKTF